MYSALEGSDEDKTAEHNEREIFTGALVKMLESKILYRLDYIKSQKYTNGSFPAGKPQKN